MDIIERNVRKRAKKFYTKNKKLAKRLEKLDGTLYKCECGNEKWVMYTVFGGQEVPVRRGKSKRVEMVTTSPTTYNFVCDCGKRLVLRKGTFNYAKIRYGCKADKCPDGKTKMNQDCLKCKFIYEK